MPDIELRFGKDMLVLSAPTDSTLARQGINTALDRQYLNLMEPDIVTDALRLELMAGAQCLVTTTEDITRARLAHVRMEGNPGKLAQSALDIASDLKPQHVLAEIGPCGLPLDTSSKASLNENRAQYADAARAFEGGDFDAFFLNGFTSIVDMKCALMGVAQVSGKPVFASMLVGADDAAIAEGVPEVETFGNTDDTVIQAAMPLAEYELFDNFTSNPVLPSNACLSPDLWPEAVDAMVDLGASVVGFETAETLHHALAYAQAAVERTSSPVLAQLRITRSNGEGGDGRRKALIPIEQRTDYAPDTMERAAVKLYGAGVQFLRATGLATPAYTGALAATVLGLDPLPRS